MNSGILILILFFGIVLVVIDLTRETRQCPKQQIVYRYIPRTFDQEQDEPVYPSDIFKTMFTQASAWNNGLNDFEQRRNLDINKYFISQV